MKIWTSEHVFNHNWDAVVTSQFRKYPNPHNTAVLGTDVYDRRVDPETGILHSHRIITSGTCLYESYIIITCTELHQSHLTLL